MVLARWQGTITDDEGNVIENATVTVRREVTGAPLAVLYSDRDGLTPVGNPQTTDAEGFVGFHVAGGAYRITAVSGDFSRVWRYVAVGLGAETDDITIGVGFTFDDGVTDADPGTGAFRFDNADPSLATKLFVSQLTPDSVDVAAWLGSWDDGGSSVDRGTVVIQGAAGSALIVARVTGTITDDGDYFDIPVTILVATAASTFVDGSAYGISFQRAGTDGAVAGPGPIVLAGQFVTFTDTDGNNIQGAAMGGSPNTPVMLATDAEVQASTDGKLIHAGQLQSANAYEALTDAATVSWDWSTAFNFTLTIAANRALALPTNGIPGQYRTILVQGNDGTDRTLTFAAYGGEVPTLTDIDSTRWYKLYIECITSTVFAVSAKRVFGT